MPIEANRAPDADAATSAAEPVGPMGSRGLPLTERVLRALPGPRAFWMIAWASMAPLRPLVLLVTLGFTGESARLGSPVDVFLSQGVFAYVILLALWGSRRLIEQVRSLTDAITDLAPAGTAARAFPHLTSVIGPIGLTAVVVAIATPSTALEFGVLVAVIDIPLLFLMILPIGTFLWTYLAILAGLHRLGQARLALDLFPQDRTLGLRPVGAVAFTGFWLVSAAAVPPLLLTGRDVMTFVLNVALVVVTVVLFILSLARLHGQMRAAKATVLAMAHGLVVEAYAPIRADTTLATVTEHASALSAAQALVDRAEKILEWPIDERTVAFMTVVVTGVCTSLVVRLVLLAAGI